MDSHAERVMLRFGDRVLTYGQALDLGRSLIAPLPPGRSLVVLRCSLTVETIASYCALVCAGHVPLLLEASLSDDLVERLCRIYRPNWVLDPSTGLCRAENPDPVILHPDLALLLTTSGSTGSPKLVRLSAEGVLANARAIAGYLDLGPGERALLHLPVSYSYGLSIVHSHIVAGATLCLTQGSVMEPTYWDDLRRHDATSIAGVPFHYTTLRRFGEARLDYPSLRTLTQAGGRLDSRLVQWFADWAGRTGRRFFVMYGQTEAGPRIAYLPPDRALEAPDAIGVPIPGVTIRLVDEEGAPVAAGAAGEMVVDSPALMMGYALNSGDLALGDTLGGHLATGDVAILGSDGLLRIVGRRSKMIKIFGLRINLDEVESRLAGMGLIAHCFGADDNLRVLLEGDADAAFVRQTLVDLYSVPPRGIEVRSGARVERTGAGKISATALQQGWDAAAA